MADRALSSLFLAYAGRSELSATVVDELEGILTRIIALAESEWSNVELDPAHFLRHIAERLPPDAELPQALSSLHASDLYLACACSTGDARALAAFERAFLSQVSSFVSKIDSSAAFADEVRQILREKLFVARPGERAKIAEYSGAGSLGSWLRVAAIRAAQNLVRRKKPIVPIDERAALQLRATAPDPELDYLRTQYADEFRQVFHDVLAELPAKDKNILSMHFLDQMSSAAIGALYGVHGATVRRWIERSREILLRETRRRLQERLKLKPNELDSVMRMVQSDLDLSISRFLRAPPA